VDCQNGLEKRLIDRHRRQFRTLFQKIDPELLNFSSLDFLNLTSHPYLKEKGISSTLLFGSGSHPSRPIGGFLKELRRSERKLTSLLGYESATFLEPIDGLFSHLLQSLITKQTLIIQHRHFPYPTHYPKQTKVFETKNFTQLQSILSKTTEEPLLFLIESIDSKTGAIEDLDAIIELAISHKALLVVDDSNSIEVFGRYGMGLASGKTGVDLLLGNFGKNFGSFVSYFASSKAFKDLLLKKNPELYRQMLLSPFLHGIVDAALDLIPSMDMERTHILNQAKKLKLLLYTQGFSPLSEDSHLMSLSFASQHQMQTFNLHLTDNHCQPSIPIGLPGAPSPLYTKFILNSKHSSKDLHKMQLLLKSSTEPKLHTSL